MLEVKGGENMPVTVGVGVVGGVEDGTKGGGEKLESMSPEVLK